MDPAGLRETEFACGGSRRRKPTGLAPFATVFRGGPIKSEGKRGPRPGFEIAMSVAAGCAIEALRAGVRLAPSRWQAPTGQGDISTSRPIEAANGGPADSSGPWKWPWAVERDWRCGCGLFSGPNIAACYVSGSVHVWPVAGWPWKWPGAVERGWRSGCGMFSGPRIPACYVSGSVHVWPWWAGLGNGLGPLKGAGDVVAAFS